MYLPDFEQKLGLVAEYSQGEKLERLRLFDADELDEEFARVGGHRRAQY